jgi:glucose-1-phosphate adenylyltransferase
VYRSVVSAGVLVEAGAEVSDSVLLPGVRIGKGAIVRGAILDKNVVVPDGAQVGVDLALDRARYPVSVGGVVVLGKGATAL